MDHSHKVCMVFHIFLGFFNIGHENIVTLILNFRRSDRTPVKSSTICSCHFKDGNKSNGPAIFQWNEDKRFQCHSPKKKKLVNM